MAQAFGLYTHIQSNRRRSGFLIASLFMLIYAMIFAGALAMRAFSGRATLSVLLHHAFNDMVSAIPVATIVTLLWIFIAYHFHQSMIDSLTDSHSVSRQEAPELYNLLENLCISRGLVMPQLKIMESPVLNAFASGLNDKQYAVTVTRGLLETLNRAELEAVLAHELTHIRNGDVRLMVVAIVIAGVISFVAEIIFRWFSYGPTVRIGGGDDEEGKRTNPAMAALFIAAAVIALAWLLSGVLRYALSRSREYLADAGAVELTKDPDAMISALLKISGRAEIPGAPSGIMEMCIENANSGLADLFATHPSIESRVQALIDNAGGRLPTLEAPKPSFIPPTITLDRKLSPWGAQRGSGPWQQG